jgi:hypothetical protein
VSYRGIPAKNPILRSINRTTPSPKAKQAEPEFKAVQMGLSKGCCMLEMEIRSRLKSQLTKENPTELPITLFLKERKPPLK